MERRAEHYTEYKIGRYRVVEQIAHIKEGYRWQVTAYDDDTAREMPWHPQTIIRFDANAIDATLEAAHLSLGLAVAYMRRSIAEDMT